MKLTVAGKQTQIAGSVWVWYAGSQVFQVLTTGQCWAIENDQGGLMRVYLEAQRFLVYIRSA